MYAKTAVLLVVALIAAPGIAPAPPLPMTVDGTADTIAD